MPTGADLLAAARTLTALSYRLDPPPDGATTIDCSLLILLAAQRAGIPLQGVRTAEQIRQATIPIGWDEVKPGDLLFFEHTYDAAGPAGDDGKIASHVGISLGRGTLQMLDAHERDGADVAVTNIGTSYWQDKLLSAGRLPGLANETPNIPEAMPRGIDVSNNNGSIDWPQVAASGVQFAFMKATEGVGFRDRFLPGWWSSTKQLALTRGAYDFGRPDKAQPEAEARYFLDYVESVGLEPGDLLALDLEDYNGSLDRAILPVAQWTVRWVRYIHAATGFLPLIYSNASTILEHGLAEHPELAECGLWLASWRVPTPPQAPPPWDVVLIHQYEVGEDGTMPGVSGQIDLNRVNGTLDDLRRYGKPGAAASAPEPAPIVDPLQAKVDGLVNAVAYLADDVAEIKDRRKRLAEAQRVREQYVGPRP